ncbi:Protein btg1 [Halocaridina rubra]|uniref:Protein btg1 n=1 Tax=Halocaridina rubra TaxID=373956 RepID=A0AAN8X0H2_HALRR
MRIEITSAAQFLVDLVRLNSAASASTLSEEQLEEFKGNVSETLQRHYTNHWFPEKPFKGSGYRCIRINGKMDPLIARAGFMMGLAVSFLRSLFPSELTMWVDPREVSYRIGENGSICILYEGGEKPLITTKKGEDVPLNAPTEVKTPEKALKAPPPPQHTPSPPPALPQHHQPPPPPPPQHHVHHPLAPHHQHQHHFSPSSPLQQQSPPMSPVQHHQHHHHQHHHHQQQQAAAAAMQLSMFLMNTKDTSGLIKCKESLPRGLEARSLQMDRLFVSS